MAEASSRESQSLRSAEETDVITAAARSLAAAGGPSDFVLDLFGRVPAEDLAPYSPAALASLATAAHRHLTSSRHSGADGVLDLVDVAVERDGAVRELTILEAINDNKPFLLESILAELDEQGHAPLLVAHPILGVERDRSGDLVRVVGETTASRELIFARESLIHIHLDRIDDEAERTRIGSGIRRVLRDVALVAGDEEAMQSRVAALAEQSHRAPAPPATEGAAAVASFLAWLLDGNFVLLGVDEREPPPRGEGAASRALGLLRDPDIDVYDAGRDNACDGFETAALMSGEDLLVVTKASTRSTVHRFEFLDCVGIKTFEPRGIAWIVGLFAPSAYACPTRDIPILRRKLAKVAERAGFDPTSHAGRKLMTVLESYPRDELYQIEPDRLLRSAMAIVDLAERHRVRVLQRPDAFGRFASLLVYVPRDRFDAEAQARIGAFLAERFGGRLTVSALLPSEGPLARLHFVVRGAGAAEERDARALEEGIAAIVRTWGDELRGVLEKGSDGRRARALAARYAGAFSGAYRERFAPREALADIAVLEALCAGHPLAFRLGGSEDAGQVRLKAFSHGTPLALSDRVPVLENLGFRVLNERTYKVTIPHGPTPVWLHDMLLARIGGPPADLAAAARPLEEALLALGDGRTESDGYNRLVLDAGLDWREAALMRTLGRYLRQLRIRYGQDYLAATLSRHAGIAARIVALFHARFDPTATDDREAALGAIRAEIEADLGTVTSLDDDRILRRFVNLVEAAVRTSFYQRDAAGRPRETIAVKMLCAKVTAMPPPRPMFEIFLSSPRVEGLHLRYGYVARGGLRWSDRPEDFRTEILGLIKAQQVKNAVIVPVGAKGGFVPKRLPPATDRQALLAEATASYRLFIRTLLDLTDNIVDGAIVPPADTVRHDPDDAYLVVAADKGTATFSDAANAISIERAHWLGDAFASGGSQGYDHKSMGITARGAWEAVKRHFREMDVDSQTDPVSVAGVGDMSGDVFGNGMLLSRSLRLVAAFDHRDIFLDPDPDPAASFAERQRLLGLPRSSWADYDKCLISPGGGVFARSLKSVELAESVRRALGIDQAEASPVELVQAILMAPVDLLWFGGIGTYVRASGETDEDASDKANDAVRITGAMLRAKVVGEGANLGLTQRGRIEAAMAGVRVNTDAIDNSAGVNTSDVEVNIKIALMTPERDGRLDGAGRRALLASMTDEVAALVLRNNQLQTLALSLAQRGGAASAGFAMRLMQVLEAEGRLDRKVELLPEDATLAERQRRGDGLTRPEWAVLLAYAKLALHDALLASAVPDDPYFERELQRYFPSALRDRFPDAVAGHRLRREIIATALSNVIVNRGSPTLMTRLIDETGTDAAAIAKAYVLTRDAYGLAELNAAIDGLGSALPSQAQLGLYAEVQDLLADRIKWFVRTLNLAAPLAPIAARYREGVAAVEAALPNLLGPPAAAALSARARDLEGHGMASAPAHRLAALKALGCVPDIVRIAEGTGLPLPAIAATHFAVDRAFRFEDLMAAARSVPASDTFDQAALEQALAGLAAAHRRLTADVLAEAGDGPTAVDAWCAAGGPALARIREAIDTIASSGPTIAKAVVAARLVNDLAKRG